METSVYLARLLGPVILIMGLTLLLNRTAIIEAGKAFIEDRAALLLAGLLALVGGVAIVNAHNVWVADWPVLITVLGWAMIVGGVMRIGVPNLTRDLGRTMIGRAEVLMPVAVLYAAAGAGLTWIGYLG